MINNNNTTIFKVDEDKAINTALKLTQKELAAGGDCCLCRKNWKIDFFSRHLHCR